MDNKKKYQLPTLTMQAGDSGAVAVVDVTGIIGWEDCQCLEFADKLQAAASQGATSITLRVNSPGGDVFSALNMYDTIRACKLPIRAEVHGLAASAASLLVMAADKVAMSESAQFMVHQPVAGVWGNPDEIMNYAHMLMRERTRMFGIYGAKCGKPWDQVSEDHAASVYYSAEEAIAYGFVDEVIHDDNENNGGEEASPAPSTSEAGEDGENENPGAEEEKDNPPAVTGMTGSRTKLTAATGSICLRIFGLGKKKDPDPVTSLKTVNAILKAENAGLKAQLSQRQASQEQQSAVIAQLVDKQVTSRLAALGIPTAELPPAAETDQPASARSVTLPSSKAEFLALSVDDRLAAVAADSEGMKKFL